MNAFGIGSDHFGGYSELASLRSAWLVPCDKVGLGGADAMRIGTAGFTAMMCVEALEKGGVKPG